jgi:hypothetical protein
MDFDDFEIEKLLKDLPNYDIQVEKSTFRLYKGDRRSNTSMSSKDCETTSQEALLAKYTPPTWHNNYDNSHLLEFAQDGTIRPKPEYQAYADSVNRELQHAGSSERLVWDDITASFVSRPVSY